MSFFMHCASKCRVYDLCALAKTSALLKGGRKHNAVLLVLNRRCDSRFLMKKENILWFLEICRNIGGYNQYLLQKRFESAVASHVESDW